MNLLEKAKRTLADAEVRFNEALDALENATEDITAEDLEALETEMDEAETERSRATAQVEKYERIYKAREDSPVPSADVADERVVVVNEPDLYRKGGPNSFFRDLVTSKTDFNALKRLSDHSEYVRSQTGAAESRDVTSSGGGAGFIPPIYLASEWAKLARAGRKFADRMPKMAMPPQGETVTIPKVSTGVTEDVQNPENSGVSQTDIATTTVTAPMVTIAGQNNISRQSLERSFPGLDEVIFDDLMRAYDVKIDSQLLTGSGSSGQHLGINQVSGRITVTYTQTTPDGGTCLQNIYGAISKVASQRFAQPDLIVMHPRRAAWLASTLSSTFPLFQQGGLFHADGTQDEGFVGTIAGLPVMTDPNVPTNLGAGTNQDQIYVLYTPDFRLAEDELRQATFEEVLSGNLTVRLQLFAYSFWVPNRYPASIAVIDGTGLVAPANF